MFLLGISSTQAQNTEGYIMQVDNSDRIYINLCSPDVKVSDVLSIFSTGGTLTDPRTGRIIQKEPEFVGQIKITSVSNNYSIGRALSGDYFEAEMIVRKGGLLQTNIDGELTVMIAPAELNFPQGVNTTVGDGYIGDYSRLTIKSRIFAI